MKPGRSYRISEAQFTENVVLNTNGAKIIIDSAVTPTGYAGAHLYFPPNAIIFGKLVIEVDTVASPAAACHIREGAYLSDGIDITSATEITSPGVEVTGADTYIGFFKSTGVIRPLVVDAGLGNGGTTNWASGFHLKGHDITTYTRGIKLIRQENLIIASGTMKTRSVHAVAEAPAVIATALACALNSNEPAENSLNARSSSKKTIML
jgi:hypothetical protein